ncbi:hypothetical protein L484_008774 [Morus notabilis]|uniref:Uncharacterized protein n=1 Tax=Morus notabilis TaxID=981085 RepID=W9S8W5_9ROSA|nr:hypothetical protein L484_008774 [Morus notabilis]
MKNRGRVALISGRRGWKTDAKLDAWDTCRPTIRGSEENGSDARLMGSSDATRRAGNGRPAFDDVSWQEVGPAWREENTSGTRAGEDLAPLAGACTRHAGSEGEPKKNMAGPTSEEAWRLIRLS